MERRWPESERHNSIETPTVGDLLTRLENALAELPNGEGGVLADDPVIRRKALSLKVRFHALSALENRMLAADRATPIRTRRPQPAVDTDAHRRRGGAPFGRSEVPSRMPDPPGGALGHAGRRLDALASKADDGCGPVVDGCGQEGSLAGLVLGILRDELHRDLCNLMIGALGYYALPAPRSRPGDNEEPLGGAYARSIRQGMLAGLFAAPGNSNAQRDRLARRLLEARNTAGSATGH